MDPNDHAADTGREPAPNQGRRLLGLVLIALGLAGIVWGVFHVLGPVGDLHASQPGIRPGYDRVKVSVHATWFGGFVRALGGLALAMFGSRLRGGAS